MERSTKPGTRLNTQSSSMWNMYSLRTCRMSTRSPLATALALYPLALHSPRKCTPSASAAAQEPTRHRRLWAHGAQGPCLQTRTGRCMHARTDAYRAVHARAYRRVQGGACTRVQTRTGRCMHARTDAYRAVTDDRAWRARDVGACGLVVPRGRKGPQTRVCVSHTGHVARPWPDWECMKRTRERTEERGARERTGRRGARERTGRRGARERTEGRGARVRTGRRGARDRMEGRGARERTGERGAPAVEGSHGVSERLP
jgi:hypothetical protein